MFQVKACVILVLMIAFSLKTARCEIGNAGLNASEQIRYFGYPLEIHKTITSDGYILELHHIPYGLNGATYNNEKKPVVFIMHGVYSTSGVFNINHRNKSLPYILADKGYDVWLGNGRGTPFSLGHVLYDANKDKEKYWNFTVTEFSVNDISASIDYVLNETGKSQLHYIGHSQANIEIFILLAEKPEYNQKVRVISLAPVSYMTHFPPLFFRVLIEISDTFQSLFRILGIYKVGVNIHFATKFQQTFPLLYEAIYFFIFGGADSKLFDRELFPAIASVLGGDVALKVIIHYDQLHKTGRFCHFDYGESGNLVAYGQEIPPDYNIKNIKAPIAVFYAPRDYLVAKQDLLRFVYQLPNLFFLKEMSYKHFSHFDFLWAKTVKEDVFDQVLELIEQHTQESTLTQN